MRKPVTACFEPTLVTGFFTVPLNGLAHATGCHVDEPSRVVAALVSAVIVALEREPFDSKPLPMSGTMNVRPRTRRPFTTSPVSQWITAPAFPAYTPVPLPVTTAGTGVADQVPDSCPVASSTRSPLAGTWTVSPVGSRPASVFQNVRRGAGSGLPAAGSVKKTESPGAPGQFCQATLYRCIVIS